jgi:hypothetical protein
LKKIGIVAVAAIAALVLGFGIRATTQTAQAEVTGAVAIGCELLAPAIDGDTTNTTTGADVTAACDGISAADVANLAAALGDEDDELEESDFADIDLDLNQMRQASAGAPFNSLNLFAFVDDDEAVTFDSDAGVTTVVWVDATGAPSADADVNAETCGAADDLDCDNSTPSSDDGDGVVAATISADTADPGDSIGTDIEQADNPDAVTSLESTVTDDPDDLTVTAIEAVIETSADVDECVDTADATDADQLGDPNRTFLIAVATDNDGNELTRVPVDWSVDDADIGEIGSFIPTTLDGGAAGIGSFAVLCGGETTGTVTATAEGAGEETDIAVQVVGPPETITLTASPASVVCDGTQSATVTAQVVDSAGSLVANGNNVNFSVVALGTANPINVETAQGTASSTITPLSGTTAGVTVIVTSGEAQSSIRVDCFSSPAATATAGGVVGTPTTGGTISPPDTGNGGYLGQDSSAGLSLWTLVALALGGIALVAGGTLARKVNK